MFVSNMVLILKKISFNILMAFIFLPFIFISPPANALKIVAHFTSGPCSTGNEGEFPCKYGQTREIDGEVNANDGVVSPKEAVLIGTRNWEEVVKDNITLEVEFYYVDAFDFYGMNESTNLWFLPQDKATLDSGIGYNTMLQLLKKKNLSDGNTNTVVSLLPNFAQLNLALDPIASGLPQNYKPSSLAIHSAQLKALGVHPGRELNMNIDGPRPRDGLMTITDPTTGKNRLIDGTVALASPEVMAFFGENWDFDPRDGIGELNLTLADWQNAMLNKIYGLSNSSVPPGANNSRPFDFVSTVTHELGHLLGWAGTHDDLDNNILNNRSREQQYIHVLDLLRILDTQLAGITSNAGVVNFSRLYRITDTPIIPFINPMTQQPIPGVFVEGEDNYYIYNFEKKLGLNAFQVYGKSTHNRDVFPFVYNDNFEFLGVWVLELPAPIMSAFSLRHTPGLMHASDLQLLDISGYNIDYSGIGRQNLLPDYDNIIYFAGDQAGTDPGIEPIPGSVSTDNFIQSQNLKMNYKVNTFTCPRNNSD